MSSPVIPVNRALTLRILWFAIAVSILMYGLIGWLIRKTGGASSAMLPPALQAPGVAPLLALAVTALGFGLAWFVGGAGTAAAVDAEARWGRIQRGVILGGVFAEVPAILGLALLLLGLPLTAFLYFLAGALLIHMAGFFRLQGWIAEQRSAGL